MCDTAIPDSGKRAVEFMRSIDAFSKSWPAVMCKIWVHVVGSEYELDAWTDVGPDSVVVYPGGQTVCTVVDKVATFKSTANGTNITLDHNATSTLTVAMVMAMLVIMLVQMFL